MFLHIYLQIYEKRFKKAKQNKEKRKKNTSRVTSYGDFFKNLKLITNKHWEFNLGPVAR